MKKKRIITTAALCLSLCLFTGAKIENVKAEGIAIENPEDIVQYQLGTMRMDVQQEQLDEILNGLETVTLADEKSQKSLTRGDDFLAILLIHEDGQKDILHFPSQILLISPCRHGRKFHSRDRYGLPGPKLPPLLHEENL